MPTNPSHKKHPDALPKLFIWAQIAAFIGTAVDFIMVYIFTEWIGLWYVISNVIGATCGAITNFLLGRYWVFLSTESKIYHQAFRYALVSVGSVILNTLGVYLLTEYVSPIFMDPLEADSLYYMIPKVIVAVIIAIFYNFILQKNFVFKQKLPAKNGKEHS